MKETEKIIEKVKMVIVYQRTDSLLNHFLTTLTLKHDYSGSVQKDSFIIWSLSHWIGLLYPVIRGTISNESGKPKVTLRAELNSFGRILIFGLLGLITYGIISGVIIQDDNSWPFLWKKILLGIGLILIPIILFRLLYRYEKRNELAQIKKILNKSLNIVTSQDAQEQFNIEQYILVKNANVAKLLSAIQKMSDLYSNTPYSRGIVVFKSDIEKDTYLLNFSNQPDFEQFKYFVNYLHYSEIDGLNAVVTGYRTISEEDGLPQQIGQRVMIYISKNDNEYDNVHATFNRFEGNIKLGFSSGEENVPLDLKEKNFEEHPIESCHLYLERIIHPNNNKTAG